MTFSVNFLRGALVLLGLLALGGCLPGGQSALDEEKEPHFLTGKSRRNAMDFDGAIDSFEKAIEVNPRSAAAHFELGQLYEQNKQDYAAAIYHYDRYLKLRPKPEYADDINKRILACKQELARTVSLAPVTQSLQHDFEQLTQENQRLREEIEKWRAAAARSSGAAGQPERAGNPVRETGGTGTALNGGSGTGTSSNRTGRSQPAAGSRTHNVKAGETPTGIARQYGIKVSALMAANPNLDERRLRVGQPLNIPSP
jgi:tetratricopeptide (TPR) repeat protein